MHSKAVSAAHHVHDNVHHNVCARTLLLKSTHIVIEAPLALRMLLLKSTHIVIEAPLALPTLLLKRRGRV